MSAQSELSKNRMELVSRLKDVELDRDMALGELEVVEAKIQKAETRRDRVKPEIFQKVVAGYIEKRDELKEQVAGFDHRIVDIKEELEEIRVAEKQEQERREQEERERRELEERKRREAEELADLEKNLAWLREKKEQVQNQMVEPSDTIEEMEFRNEMEEFETPEDFRAAITPAREQLEELKAGLRQVDHKMAKLANRRAELGGEAQADFQETRSFGGASMGSIVDEVSPIDEQASEVAIPEEVEDAYESPAASEALEAEDDDEELYDPLTDVAEKAPEEAPAPPESQFDPNLIETKPYDAVEEEELYEPDEVFEPEEIIEDEVEEISEPAPADGPDPMAETIKAPVYVEPETEDDDDEGGMTVEEEIVETSIETEMETGEIDEEVISEELIEDEESLIEAASDAASAAVNEAIEGAIAPLSEEDKEFFGDMEAESEAVEHDGASEQEKQFFSDAADTSVVLNSSIVLQDPSGKQQVFELVHDIMIVGSAGLGDVDIHIPHPSVDKKHARIKLERGHYVVKDLRSKNGTFVNGKKVRKSRLNHMDKLKFGDIFFQVRLP
jgi:FHA domain